LTGEGSRLYGTRWTGPGKAIVSTSSTLSLSALEYLVHLDVDLASDDLVSVEIHIADGAAVRFVHVGTLRKKWRVYPAPAELADLGDAWHEDGKELMLSVPSAVIPHERNMLINPAQREFAKSVRIQSVHPFSFDERLLRKR
jgi:RES domain-containing protein